MLRFIFNITLIVLALILIGCNVRPVYEVVANVNPLEWHQGDTVKVVIINDDTTNLRDISVILRSDDNLQRETIDIIIRTYAPDSVFCEEPLTISLKNKNTGNIFSDIETPYRFSSKLSQKGRYTFEFILSENNLKGVNAIGIKLIRTDRKSGTN